MSEEIVRLTDEEWMSLIDKTREDGLGMCCANISDLRDYIVSIARAGGCLSHLGHDLLWAYEHNVKAHPGIAEIPALRRLIDQTRDLLGRNVLPGRCCGTCRHWIEGCNLGRVGATSTDFCFEYSRAD